MAGLIENWLPTCCTTVESMSADHTSPQAVFGVRPENLTHRKGTIHEEHSNEAVEG